jgi:DHA2 family multidrug resistance protein
VAAASKISTSSPAASAIVVPSNKWLVAVAVMLATIMEVLDTTIANVALLHIRGSLSAGVDEAAWVLTSYIVSNAIVIPLTGWCGSYFGRKRFFNFCILLFTFSSFMCGCSVNLTMLVFFRILQGAGGGALMPMSQAILMETFPPEEQATAMSVWGTGMMVGPVLGPIVGGWITDNYSWRWIFYINVPIGAIAFLMVYIFVADPGYLRRTVKRIDWWGLGYLALGIGAIQILLDKGERLDWFDSSAIRILGVTGAIAITAFIVRELRTREPIVDLRVLKNRTFAVGVAFIAIVMFGMYGTMVLIPLFCQSAIGYTPLLAGYVMTTQSLGSFLAIMVAGRLFNKFDPRYMVAAGCIISGIGVWEMASFNPQVDFWGIAGPGFLRGIGTGMIFIPMTTLSLSAVPREQMGTASGLYNMVRTVGGSIGIAVLVAMLSSHGQIHQAYLNEHINPLTLGNWERTPAVAGYMAMMGPGDQQAPMLAMLSREMQHQATVMAFLDDFRIIAYLFFALTPVAFIMKRTKRAAAVSAH